MRGPPPSKGIIPAGAGRRQCRQCSARQQRDHPRGCGEKGPRARRVRSGGGSSPRVRGEAAQLARAQHLPGIIPAGAGRSRRHREGARRGEGSSPRVRGEAEAAARLAAPTGIIPAGAGRSSCPGRWRGSTGDHPRGCGEKSSACFRTAPSPGSSPRVRGEACRSGFQHRQDGIIPAGAGRSGPRRRERAPSRDHPRGCGEKVHLGREVFARLGSSPRVRGEVPGELGHAALFGIIPAGAGRRLEKV